MEGSIEVSRGDSGEFEYRYCIVVNFLTQNPRRNVGEWRAERQQADVELMAEAAVTRQVTLEATQLLGMAVTETVEGDAIVWRPLEGGAH